MESQSQNQINAAEYLPLAFSKIKAGIRSFYFGLKSNLFDSVAVILGLLLLLTGWSGLKNPELFANSAFNYSVGLSITIWGGTKIMNNRNESTQKKILDALERIEEKLETLPKGKKIRSNLVPQPFFPSPPQSSIVADRQITITRKLWLSALVPGLGLPAVAVAIGQFCLTGPTWYPAGCWRIP